MVTGDYDYEDKQDRIERAQWDVLYLNAIAECEATGILLPMVKLDNPHGSEWQRIQWRYLPYYVEPFFEEVPDVGDGSIHIPEWSAVRGYTAVTEWESAEGYRALYGWSVDSQAWHLFAN